MGQLLKISTFGLNRKDFFGILTQAFRSPADRPLRNGQGRVRGDLPAGLGVLAVSVFFWFLMNASFQPRFLPGSFSPRPWTFISLGGNLFFGLALLILPKTRPLAFIPLFFTLFPLVFLIMSLFGEILQNRIPKSAAAGGQDWKFIHDCLFFALELVFMGLFLILSRTGSPLGPREKTRGGGENREKTEKFVRFWEILFIAAVLLLLGKLLFTLREQFPPRRILALLKYQIPFSILLGLKEELSFRWILLRKGEEIFGSRLVSVCSMTLIWGLYHGLFGEGVGRGFWPAFWVCVVSFWWSLLSYRYNSIGPAWVGHTAVELYGFYLLYIPFMG